MSFDTNSPFRWVLYLMAAVIVSGSLLYANYLARQLAAQEQERVQLFADAQKFFADPDLDETDPSKAAEAFFFIFKVKSITGAGNPIILLGEDNTITSTTVEVPEGMDEGAKDAYLERMRLRFIEEYDPIQVEFGENRFQTVIYGESQLLKALRWFPIAQLLAAFTFIGIVLVSFLMAKRSEQNKVWVGLAKETAHQLGTPISSLMAWIELLKLSLEDRSDEYALVDDMEHDVKRLENIAERFSKIGSVPELIAVKLRDVLDHSAEYLTKRMTRSGNIQLHVHNRIDLDSVLHVNPQLFDWVIENLLKNALDALQAGKGSITLEAGEKGEQVYIDVSDTGKGIPRGNLKKVFTPGFTTKKRGWGLGLSLTKRIVENYHRGKIFVKHSEVGKGTTFRILLPKEAPRPKNRSKQSVKG